MAQPPGGGYAMNKLIISVGAAALLVSAPASAWNKRGHMIVAATAWEQLSPASRAAVGRLLRHNPLYSGWTSGVAAPDRDRVAFIRAAAWPDDIKNSNYQEDGNKPPPGPSAFRNTGYDDCLQHKYWHYKDIPLSRDRPAMRVPDTSPDRQPPSPNAETQIATFARVLTGSEASDQLKSYDLAWLIHLVGDVHQPLHATSRFLPTDSNGDDGGLGVRIRCDEQRCSGLHSYWDGALDNAWYSVTDERRDEDRARLALAGQPDPDPGEAANLSPRDWMLDSFDLAVSEVYRTPIGNGLGPFTITETYRRNAKTVAQRQAVLAAARLANLINRTSIVVRGDPLFTGRCVRGRFRPGGGRR